MGVNQVPAIDTALTGIQGLYICRFYQAKEATCTCKSADTFLHADGADFIYLYPKCTL